MGRKFKTEYNIISIATKWGKGISLRAIALSIKCHVANLSVWLKRNKYYLEEVKFRWIVDQNGNNVLPDNSFSQGDFFVFVEKTDNNYSAHIPSLPGCVATGNDVPEVLKNLAGAIKMHQDF